jgi:L-alanine-DL-glutamate epimerase-like enolase superfamily enzyme
MRWRWRALKTAQELEQLGVVWLEEPLPRYDFEHQSKLCGRMSCIRAVSIYIAGGEGNKGLHEAHQNASAHRAPQAWAASAP